MNRRTDVIPPARVVAVLGLDLKQIDELRQHLPSCEVRQVGTVEALLAARAAARIDAGLRKKGNHDML